MTIILAEDAALKTYLQGMTVVDEKNTTRPVKVWYGYPDIEIRNQDFPFVVIELINVRAANERQHSGLRVDNDYMGTQTPTIFATVGSTTVYKSFEYEIPVAYDLVYQVASYARHPLHDRSIMFQLMQKFPSKYGYLAVPNALGTETAYRHMFIDSSVKRDTTDNVSGARRLLSNVYTIRVISEMTPATAATASSTILSGKINAANPPAYSVQSGQLAP